MTTIVIDDATFAKIRAAGGSVRLTNMSGAVAAEAQVTNQLDPSQFLGRWMTDEEAARYVAEELDSAECVTAAEVEQRLRELRKCS